MIILDAGLEDDAVQASIDRATQVITANGGEPGRLERWGKRRFAYELDHRWEGIYLLLHATSEPPAMAALDRQLRLADEVVRHKVIRLPDQIADQRSASTSTAPADAGASNGG